MENKSSLERKPTISCDVLVVGGGIAGMMAGIGAAEKGADTIIVEKANTMRSGSGASGNDHFQCYMPEYHGPNRDAILREMEEAQTSGCNDRFLLEKFADLSGAQAKEWDEWGIPMRPTGDWDFNGHAKPNSPRIWLKYAGQDQKKILTRQARKVGCKIINHTFLTEIATDPEDGHVVGAMCVDISEDVPKIQLFNCKAVILCTGNTTRLYPPKSGGWMFNVSWCPAGAGGGRTAVYRAGARLINLDVPVTHAGPKYFNRAGKATWIGLYEDIEGNRLGGYVDKATRELGDLTGDVWMDMFPFKNSQGEPVFMDCSTTSKEDIEFMRWGLSNEGNTATLDFMDKAGIDLSKHMVEFTQYSPYLNGRGVEIDGDAAASIKGLYAAGEETGNFRADIGGAAVFGHVAGNSAAAYAKEIDLPNIVESSEAVAQKIELVNAIWARPNDTAYSTWKEANIALGQLMNDYAGIEVRSEHLYQAGLTYIGRLRRQAEETLTCNDAHELMRCLEVLDLIEIGELVMMCGRERKETRGKHKRYDYPYTNQLLNNKFLMVEKVNGEPVFTWRDRK